MLLKYFSWNGLRVAVLTLMFGVYIAQSQEKQHEEKVYPLWDGKETVEEYAKRTGLEPAIVLDLGSNIKIEFALIPAGKFIMGSPITEEGRFKQDGPQHEVTINNPFYMSRHEVTQGQYEKLDLHNNSHFGSSKHPVERVSWNDAKDFAMKLSQKTGRSIRLPSEAEWEYACRAGTTTPYCPPKDCGKVSPLTEEQLRQTSDLINSLSSSLFDVRDKAMRDLIALGRGILPLLDQVKSDDLEVKSRLSAIRDEIQPKPDIERIAWFLNNSNETTHPVGEKEPNLFGLYDMYGNVWEWCEDDLHDDYIGAPADGSAWIDNPRLSSRVIRGGCWRNPSTLCRSAGRTNSITNFQLDNIGFRVVMSATTKQIKNTKTEKGRRP